MLQIKAWGVLKQLSQHYVSITKAADTFLQGHAWLVFPCCASAMNLFTLCEYRFSKRFCFVWVLLSYMRCSQFAVTDWWDQKRHELEADFEEADETVQILRLTTRGPLMAHEEWKEWMSLIFHIQWTWKSYSSNLRMECESICKEYCVVFRDNCPTFSRLSNWLLHMDNNGDARLNLFGTVQ